MMKRILLTAAFVALTAAGAFAQSLPSSTDGMAGKWAQFDNGTTSTSSVEIATSASLAAGALSNRSALPVRSTPGASGKWLEFERGTINHGSN